MEAVTCLKFEVLTAQSCSTAPEQSAQVLLGSWADVPHLWRGVTLAAGLMLHRAGQQRIYDCTSTRKALRSFSLSMVLIATSFPFHTALKTTPNVPLPTACTKTTQQYSNPAQRRVGGQFIFWTPKHVNLTMVDDKLSISCDYQAMFLLALVITCFHYGGRYTRNFRFYNCVLTGNILRLLCTFKTGACLCSFKKPLGSFSRTCCHVPWVVQASVY